MSRTNKMASPEISETAKKTLTTLPAELQVAIASFLPRVDDLVQLQRSCRTLRDVVSAHVSALAAPLVKAQYRRIHEEIEMDASFAPAIEEGETDMITEEGRVAMGLPSLKGMGKKGKRGWGYGSAVRAGRPGARAEVVRA